MNQPNRPVQALVGHLLDLWRVLSFNFSNPHSLTKYRLLKMAQRQTSARNLIEVGTYLGVTTRRCARVFNRVFTIELSPELVRKARDLLKLFPNIEVIEGNGTKVLPTILRKQEVERAIVFLDGHFSGEKTAKGEKREPAIDELLIMAQFKDKIDAIVVDDFRTFGSEPDFPTKAELLRTLENNFPEFEISIWFDSVLAVRRELSSLHQTALSLKS